MRNRSINRTCNQFPSCEIMYQTVSRILVNSREFSRYGRNGLNVEKYLLHILTVLPERFAAHSIADVADLVPWAVEMQERFSV